MSEQNEYSMEEVLEMESIILKFFDWVFLIPTAATYIEYFCNKCFKATELNNSVVQVVQRYLDQTIGIFKLLSLLCFYINLYKL